MVEMMYNILFNSDLGCGCGVEQGLRGVGIFKKTKQQKKKKKKNSKKTHKKNPKKQGSSQVLRFCTAN